MSDAPIIIPAYQPSQPLLDLVHALHQQEAGVPILVVNDGSDAQCDAIFSALEAMPAVTVLKHEVNQGKGAALKTAFTYYQQHFSHDGVGVVTADADGQHAPEDILRVRQKLLTEPTALVMGVRGFSDKKVPLRSRFGNELTRCVFRLASKRNLHDTQTGLRGVPNPLVEQMLLIGTSGYEFELEMLMVAAEQQVAMIELPIHTIYIDHNASSHFRPVIDSAKIYFVFLRFAAISLLSFLLDFSLFSLLYYLEGSIGWAVFGARVVSGLFNFKLNRHLAFKNKDSQWLALVKYAALATVVAAVGYGMIWVSYHLAGVNVYLAKVVSEVVLYLLSFVVQRCFIFRSRA
jgi:glycosyltransferase involved in cell wall biosynthesis